MDLWIIFLTGLTVGGLTCMAVQGGLLASTIAVQRSHNVFPVLSFLVTKIIAYILYSTSDVEWLRTSGFL